MNELQKKEKKLRAILIVLIVVIIPAVFRIWDTNAIADMRNIDVLLLFVLGFASGAFVVNLKHYLNLKKNK